MRHRVKGRKLNRTASHRSATMRALATALIREKKIKTTLAKAKELRMFIEPMITRAKNDSVAARRIIAKDINDNEVIKELFNEIIPKIGDRPGGYSRVVKLGTRVGDAAEMAIIELVDYNSVVEKKKVSKPKTKKAKVIEEPVVEVVDEKETETSEVTDETIAESLDAVHEKEGESSDEVDNTESESSEAVDETVEDVDQAKETIIDAEESSKKTNEKVESEDTDNIKGSKKAKDSAEETKEGK